MHFPILNNHLRHCFCTLNPILACSINFLVKTIFSLFNRYPNNCNPANNSIDLLSNFY